MNNGKNSEKIRLLDFSQKLIYQDIIYDIDLIISRAGGATVNDAIAKSVPLILIEEPGQWQVEEIRKEVEFRELASQTIPVKIFTSDPQTAIDEISKRVIETDYDNIKEKMKDLPDEKEDWFAEEVLKMC